MILAGTKIRRAAMVALPLLVAGVVGLQGRSSKAEAPSSAEAAARCATRLSATLIGKGASAELLANANPQSQVDTMLQSPEFIERFASFLNASFNDQPGANKAEDAAYYLGKYVLQNNLPYKSLFAGQFEVVAGADNNADPTIQMNPDGLGYFRSRAWLVRYAGNEPAGYKISTGYRMMQNMLGLKLIASTNAPGAKIDAEGRQAAPCNGCHYQGWYALDNVAKVLTKRQGTGNNMRFNPPTDGPQQAFDTTINNDADIVNVALGSTAFKFNTCRLAFKFLYGRAENVCESKIFDACVDEFAAKGTIQSALAVVAKDQSFCQ